ITEDAQSLVSSISSVISVISPNKVNALNTSIEQNNNVAIAPSSEQEEFIMTDVLQTTLEKEASLVDIIGNKPLIVFGNADSDYFLKHQTGFVIQISGFVQKATFNEFINAHSNNQFHSYFRVFDEDSLFIVTSEVYSTKVLAQEALLSMPESLQTREPWIKSISAVNNEIKAFQLSQ
ncbi:hypothetical protein N8Z89_00520, partial [bacterium]|nr:hypothetical protein [bacterium]